MRVTSRCDLPVGVVRVDAPGSSAVVVVVKLTLSLASDHATMARAQEPISFDRPSRLGGADELEYASDLAPGKAHAEVLLTGHAHAFPPSRVVAARIALGGFEKRFFALASHATTSIPLTPAYLRAAPWPLAEAVSVAPRALRADRAAHDLERFDVAPRDQRVAEIAAGAVLELEGLLPGAPSRRVAIPRVGPRVFQRLGVRAEEVRLRCDTLWIDTDRSLCTLTFRGVAPLDGRGDPDLLVTLAPPDERFDAARVLAPHPDDRGLEALEASVPFLPAGAPSASSVSVGPSAPPSNRSARASRARHAETLVLEPGAPASRTVVPFSPTRASEPPSADPPRRRARPSGDTLALNDGALLPAAALPFDDGDSAPTQRVPGRVEPSMAPQAPVTPFGTLASLTPSAAQARVATSLRMPPPSAPGPSPATPDVPGDPTASGRGGAALEASTLVLPGGLAAAARSAPMPFSGHAAGVDPTLSRGLVFLSSRAALFADGGLAPRPTDEPTSREWPPAPRSRLAESPEIVVDRVAVLRVARWEGEGMFEEALAKHGVDEVAWREEEVAVVRRIAEEAARGEGSHASALAGAMRRAKAETATDGDPALGLADYVALRVALEDGAEAGPSFGRHGLTASSWQRAHRAWAARAAADAEVAAEVRRLVASARSREAPPAVGPTLPAALRPRPYLGPRARR